MVKIVENSVQETLVFPLYGRAVCSEKYPALFLDPLSEGVIKNIDYNFKEKTWQEHAVVVWALRQRILCSQAAAYLKIHPEATVIDLGCGLSTGFSTVDNGSCRWINLDIPEIISIRQELLPCGPREENLAADAFDLSWVDRAGIDIEKGVYIISGGMFYYFKPEKIKELFCGLAKRFPQGRICFDCESSYGVRESNKMVKKNGNGSKMYFAVDNPKTLFTSWSSDFKKIDVIDGLPPAIGKAAVLPFKVRLILKLGVALGIMKFVEIWF